MSHLANVIRAELFKSFRKRRTYVMAAFLWLLIPALLLLIGWLLQTRVGGTFLDDEATLSVKAVIQALASPIAITRNILVLFGNSAPLSLLIIVVALLATLLVGEEGTQNMWKTVLTAQPRRLTVLAGKFVTAMIVMGLLLAGCYLAGILFGALGMSFLPTSFGSGWLQLAGLYALQWLFTAAALLFAFLVVWLIRNLPLAIVTIFFLPGLLEAAYGFYRAVIGLNRLNRFNALLEALQLRNTFENLPRYFFTNNLSAPSRQPLAHLTELLGIAGDDLFQPGGPFGRLQPELGHSALVMAAYAVIFAVVLAWSFRRRDVS
ncbi:MAG TPA: hypothetical protein VF171_05995 [Trueperaceae bacterium]